MDDNYLDLYLDYSEMLQEARDENAKLREENAKLVKVLHEVESEAVDAYLGLQHDCELLVGELDDRFRKYWHEQCENAKLRELVADVHESLRADKAGMFHKLILASMEDDMRELGIEVTE